MQPTKTLNLPRACLSVLLLLALGGCRPAPPAAQEQADKSPEQIRRNLNRALRGAWWHPRRADAQLALGDANFEAGFFNDAYAAYRRAAELDPQNLQACLGLARVNAKLRDPGEALDWLNRALRLEPRNSEALQLRGRLLLMAGRFDQAVDSLKQALAVEPANASTWLNLSSAYAAQGLDAEAVSASRQAVRLRPDSPIAQYAFGLQMHRLGQLTEAEAAFREVLRLDPKYAPAMVDLAQTLLDRKRKLEEARQLATAASDYDTVRNRAVVLAAWITYVQGDKTRAIQDLAKLVNDNPHSPEAWRKLAIMFRGIGDEERAKQSEEMSRIYVSSTNALRSYTERKGKGPQPADE